jgi:hypothetical protein
MKTKGLLVSRVHGFVAVLFLVIAPVTQCVSGVVSNVLANPGFEEDGGLPLKGWQVNGTNPGVARVNSAAHTGTNSAKVWGHGPGPINTESTYQQFSTIPGAVWEGTAWVLNAGADPMLGSNYAVIRVEFYDAATQGLTTAESPARITSETTTNEWISLTAAGEAPPRTEFVRLHLVVVRPQPETNGVAFFDDAEFGLSQLTTLQFAGERWIVRNWSDGAASNKLAVHYSADCVSVDSNGLHLAIKNLNGQWHCAGVRSERTFGYGDYLWYVSNRVDLLDPNVVAGLFTYEPPLPSNEMDIEFTRAFTGSNTMQLHYAVQPYDAPGHKTNMPMSLTSPATAHRFQWLPMQVRYESYYGHSALPQDTNAMLGQWTFSGSGVPAHAGERVLMNLHLFEGNPPADTQHLDMVIRDFSFTAACKIHEFHVTTSNMTVGVTCMDTGRTLTFESSTNLLLTNGWQVLTKLVCVGNTTNWSGALNDDAQARFFRVKME